MSSSSQPEEALSALNNEFDDFGLPDISDAEFAEMDFASMFGSADFEPFDFTLMDAELLSDGLDTASLLSPHNHSMSGDVSVVVNEEEGSTCSAAPTFQPLPSAPTHMSLLSLPDEQSARSLFSKNDNINGDSTVIVDGQRGLAPLATDPASQPLASAATNVETQSLFQMFSVQFQNMAAKIDHLEGLLQRRSEDIDMHSLRLDYLETSLQKNSDAVKEFKTWSEGVEKHCRDQDVWSSEMSTHCGKQTARILELEKHCREQTTWMGDIEKFNREQNRTVLDLVGMVQHTSSGAGSAPSPASTITPGG